MSGPVLLSFFLVAVGWLVPAHAAAGAWPRALTRPDPETGGFTHILPKGASALRLSLPASVDDIFAGEGTGVGGYGLHAGGHPEGLDHVWISLRGGTPVRSWADGRVESIVHVGALGQDEHHIRINYGHNLIGTHMEVKKPYVRKGQRVARGQLIGMGMDFGRPVASAEFMLQDLGRTDGVRFGRSGSLVSPFDYLRKSEKLRLVNTYKRRVTEPYLRGETVTSMFTPYQPYLTNRLFLHRSKSGRLDGEWYSLVKWRYGYPVDLLTFIDLTNPYFSGRRVLSADDEGDLSPKDWTLDGTFEVDYRMRRLKIHNWNGKVLYGIFRIDESRPRPRLVIQYQEGTYPQGFTAQALHYILRSSLPRREDAFNLGLRDRP